MLLLKIILEIEIKEGVTDLTIEITSGRVIRIEGIFKIIDREDDFKGIIETIETIMDRSSSMTDGGMITEGMIDMRNSKINLENSLKKILFLSSDKKGMSRSKIIEF